MKNIEALVAVVSWEERFIKGFELDMKSFSPSHVVFFQFKGYENRNKANFENAKQICNNLNIEFKEHGLDFIDPKGNWFSIKNIISAELYSGKNVLLDITTMPREAIWSILFFLDKAKAKIDYIYYRPKKHNKEWLSRDPSDPRLLYKMSGICELGRPTLLFVFTGHDYQRVSNLVNYFEPQKLIIAEQGDEKNNEVNDKCVREFDGNILIERFRFDAYKELEGYEIISRKVEENFNNYNIVFSSLGPKVSAIPLYRINRAYPETALCYIPCKEFNVNYSDGIIKNEIVFGNLQIPERKYELMVEY